jgi:hypothetical protein
MALSSWDWDRKGAMLKGYRDVFETLLLIVQRLCTIGKEAQAALAMTEELGRMMSALTKKLKERLAQPKHLTPGT